MRKADLLDLVNDLADADDLDLDALIYTLAFRREVEKGLAAADADDELSLEDFEELTETWLA